jgi:hypothetical protein
VSRGGELGQDANPVAMGLQNVGSASRSRGPSSTRLDGGLKSGLPPPAREHPLGDPVPLGLTAFAHALTPDRRAFAAASNTELRLFRVGAKGDLETAASAALTAENVNAVLFVRR